MHRLLLAAAALLSAAPVQASSRPETHDGFFARAQVGFAYTRMTSAPLRIQGEGPTMTVAVGHSVTDELAVYGELAQTHILGPSFYPNGAYADDDTGVTARLSALGAGATFSLPSDLYAAASLQVLWASLQEMHDRDGDTRFRTSAGLGLGLSFGREWWVDDEWGLGAAAVAQLSRIADQDDTAWHNGTFGLALSATFH